MQIGAAQPGAANAHNDIPRARHRGLRDLLDCGKFMIVVHSYCFHLYSSIGSSSGPTKREPGRPHSRKKSPVARHKVTLTSLPARIKALLRRLARATLCAVTCEPSLSARSGASSLTVFLARIPKSVWASRTNNSFFIERSFHLIGEAGSVMGTLSPLFLRNHITGCSS